MQDKPIKVCYSIWDTIDTCDHAGMRKLLQDINFALDSILMPMVDKDINSMLQWAALETDYTHMVIFDSGTNMNLGDANMRAAWYELCKSEWLIAGHIMWRPTDGYPYLHKQAFAINLDIWKNCGQPEMGWNASNEIALPPVVRSDDNVHDDYTPLWLRRGHGDDWLVDKRRFGWNMIASSLRAGYDVVNLTIDIRKTKTYIYPDDNPDQLLDQVMRIRDGREYDISSIENSSQRKYLSVLEWYMGPATNTAVFIFNTGDLLLGKHELKGTHPDALWTTASGFKSFALWYCRGADPRCQINTYDYNARSLDVWKHINTNWEGSNLWNFMKEYDPNCDADNIYNWGNRLDYESPEQACNRQELQLAKVFDGSTRMKEAWQLFKSLEHRYHHVNIIENPIRFAELFERDKVHFLWLNNIFYYAKSIKIYGINKICNSMRLLAEELYNRCPNSVMHGQSVNMYFGDKPGEILQELAKNPEPMYQCQFNFATPGGRRWAGHPLINLTAE
jgi:hypothetical protein